MYASDRRHSIAMIRRRQPQVPLDPPPIAGVSRSRVGARGVDFHVTEAGPADGLPVLALHGWPQHHYEWRDLLADPPEGLRIIAPDLPGYGWSGPPPHRWQKEQVASDVLALIDQMGVERTLLVGHDWGGVVGHLLALREPERFSAYLALNIVHPWQTARTMAPHLWRFLLYQPAIAAFGVWLQQDTEFPYRAIRGSLIDRSRVSREDVHWFSDRFRDPVCARAGQDTYRTFWLEELPAAARRPETRRSSVPTRALFGVDDRAIHCSLASARNTRANDYTLELVADCGHFIADERPDIVRERLVAMAAEFPPR
ncbi:MAG TPA: alpha/beta hydrolase [Solirubrobacteraceae bacterium]|jgi:pimeloyl-ACP methyl ester carboxylesterase|nr:alpha/beta hydrolase [Solirubrobacteraceae bacterium]